MKLRTIATLAAVVALAVPAWAATHFQDVPDDHPHADAIRHAVDKGWFNGYPDGLFRPDQPVEDRHIVDVFRRAFPDGPTRAEMAAVLKAGTETLTSTTTTTTMATTTTMEAEPPQTSPPCEPVEPPVVDRESPSTLCDDDVRRFDNIRLLPVEGQPNRVLIETGIETDGAAPLVLMCQPNTADCHYGQPQFETRIRWEALVNNRWIQGGDIQPSAELIRFVIESPPGTTVQLVAYQISEHLVPADSTLWIPAGARRAVPAQPDKSGCSQFMAANPPSWGWAQQMCFPDFH